MVSQIGREDSPLIERLFDESYRFDFFQAVRLLEHYRNHLSEGNSSNEDNTDAERELDAHSVTGTKLRLHDRESVRFRSTSGMRFPSAAVNKLTRSKRKEEDDAVPEMFVSMMGLTGPSGVLPEHYTELILERLRNGDRALHEFLDLFLHRIVTLFYNAWGKYRVSIGYERAKAAGQGDDLFSQCALSLLGMGTEGQRERLGGEDLAMLAYSAHYSDPGRPASNLQDILADYLSIPVQIEQFQGSWLYLNDDDLTRLADPSHPKGAHAILGVDFVAGGRVWDIQGKFRLKLGPLKFDQFRRLLPGEDDCLSLTRLTRLYVGSDLEFDIQPILRRDEIPPFRLSADSPSPARLGWNTWAAAEPFCQDAENVFFALASN